MSDFPETPTDGSTPPSAPTPPSYSQATPPHMESPHASASSTGPALASDLDERNWAMIGHLSALIGMVVPFGSVIAPLVVWQLKKDTMPFAGEQAREALNFNITAGIAALVSMALMVVVIGFLLLPIVVLVWLVFTIIAALAASRGENYRYPLTLRLVN